MNRLQALAGLALAAVAVPAAAAVDLSSPGALERLRAHQPAHYKALVEVAQVGERLTCDASDLGDLQPFGVDRLDCGHLVYHVRRSPQRRMGFAIEGQDYVVTVRLRDRAPRLIGR
jgi:hypothetical protein